MEPAVFDRPLTVPRVEDGGHRSEQLLSWLLGKLFAGLLGEDPLELLDQAAQILGSEFRVEGDASLGLEVADRTLEQVMVDAAYHVTEHLDVAPIRIPGEALGSRTRCEAAYRLVGNAEVEHRVHHSRHRFAGPGPDRYEKWVGRVAQPLPRLSLERRQGLVDLFLDLRKQLATIQIGDACLRGHGESGGNPDRWPEARHLRDVRALPAEEIAHLHPTLGETVDVFLRARHLSGPLSLRHPLQSPLPPSSRLERTACKPHG